MKTVGPIVRMRRLVNAATEVAHLFDKNPEQAERKARDLRDVAQRYRRDCADLIAVLSERGRKPPLLPILEDSLGVFDRTIESLSKVIK